MNVYFTLIYFTLFFFVYSETLRGDAGGVFFCGGHISGLRDVHVVIRECFYITPSIHLFRDLPLDPCHVVLLLKTLRLLVYASSSSSGQRTQFFVFSINSRHAVNPYQSSHIIILLLYLS